jgi:pyruvate formate lyase activating enzyme
MSKHALIFNTHRMSTDDGPGMRTTLFFKGCPLSCFWCHNPESISNKPQVWAENKKCIGCGQCGDACPQQGINSEDGQIVIDQQLCVGCGTCVEVCPAKSLELLGKEYSVDDALKLVMKDRLFYERSGGGVTVSGGEPTMHVDFIQELFMRLKEVGIHTALDTCGLARQETFNELFPVVDIFLWDIKTIAPELHKKFTEFTNEKIIENLYFIADKIRLNSEKKLWIRTPLIPEMTSDTNNISDIAQFLSNDFYDVIERWELCAFNRSCTPKYQRLGQPWICENLPSLSEADINQLKSLISNFPKLKGKVFFTGFIKK